MPILSQEEAHDFIAKLRENNGGIAVEDRDFLAANLPSALRALQKIRRQLADSIKILVDNLYSKETHFLYELIQNAEDNSYSTATANKEKPFLAFKIFPKRIIIDSNEDGFLEDNIEAICSVGRSTKKHSGGYIGEKGIGFKSVFKVAQKVHIQSGPFSFALSHTREDDDDGLGMITPFHESAEELPVGVRTRMTLTLLDLTDFEELASDFRAIPDTFLMFLSRLQQLSIELYQSDSTHTAIQYSKRETKENGLYTTFLKKTTRKDMEESTSEQKYYTMKSDLHNLPFDEARKDKEGNSIDWATVVLAFPVDEHDNPVLEEQYTYAFLPLLRVGFNFLIQADFVTQANREDVVHSKRNQAILRGVAKAFVDAMIVLCKRPSLKYRWMRYLPADSKRDDFWSTLWIQVRNKLEKTHLLESWSGEGLYKPSDLQKLSKAFVAEDGNPLLQDIEGAEIYLSPKYTDSDFQILKRLGTTTLQRSRFVDRLDADLRNPAGSKWRVLENNDDWRTRICEVLLSIFFDDLPKTQKLRRLALIPLSDDRWLSSNCETEIYFPETDGIPIPVDLSLDLVCLKAAENDVWTDLHSELGVISCPPEPVISSIYKRYDAAKFDDFKLPNGVAHIRYLYWFLPENHRSLASLVRLANQHGSLLKKNQYLYFSDEGDDYSPSKLFKQDDQLPGHPVHFLNEAYLKAVDPVTIHHGRPWMEWLEEKVCVRRIPELRAEGHNGLSREFQYIVRHRSDRLLGTLKRGWNTYHSQMNDAVKVDLRKNAVLLENGRRMPLARTFLPFPGLKQIATELSIGNRFPFIAISELLRDEDRLSWMFVKDLQVGIEENLDFYLSSLESLKTTSFVLSTTSLTGPLTRVYRSIQSRCSECLSHVRKAFGEPVIWIPPPHRIDSSWLSIADCVWDGPQWLRSKQCLKFEVYLELEPLFNRFLKIPDAAKVDIINDLLILKSHYGDPDVMSSQSGAESQQNTGNVDAPFEGILENGERFQSITVMKGYKKNSFEEHRLEDYNNGRKPMKNESSVCQSRAFAGLELDQIIEEAEKRYKYLWQQHPRFMDNENSESRKTLRFAFEDSALVYIPKEKSWYPPSRCVWVESNVRIPGKAAIADVYPLLETFFTEVLQVSKPTVSMYIDAMKAEAKGKVSAVRIKETMRLICSLGVGEHDFASLTEAKVLPIKLANGVRDFASASSKRECVDFAIVENTIHRDAFEGKIIVLDLSLEEIRDTKPLLLALGLRDRFSSKLVREVTHVEGGSQDHGMTKTLRAKSRAIARCAFHFASPNKRQDVASLYRKFKRATVYMSEGIRRSLQITQDGRSIESASSRADFHFEEVDHKLRLYLPKDEAERDVCFESDLPRRLCTFLGLADPGALPVIGSVFRKDNPVVIRRILEKAGVSQTDCDFAALDEEYTTSETESDTETLVDATINIRLSTPGSDPRPYTPSSSPRSRERYPSSEKTERVRDEIMPSSSGQKRQADIQEAAYKRILEHVVDVASQRVLSGVFESTADSVGNTIATEALPGEIFPTAFPTHTQERDFKVGAAGELYMFEYLKRLGLPRFDYKNWKSEIRDRVKIHPRYHDIEEYKDRSAIADIEYPDDSGTLTRFLSRKGHLSQGLWENERPFYHIEVKTTTSPKWQEPFYMSKAQERHICNMGIEDGKTRSSIYMICRIFNLGKGDQTGMHVYLDPETKRRNQELEFSAHTWAVKPLVHPKICVENGLNRASAATQSTTLEGMTSETHGNTDTRDAKREPGALSFTAFGSSTSSDSVLKSSDSTLRSSTLPSQAEKKSMGGSRFDFNSAPSMNKPSAQTPPNGSVLGTTDSASSSGISSRLDNPTHNSDTSKSPSVSLFGSSPLSLNNGTSKPTPKGGLFGSKAISSNDPGSKPSFTARLPGMTADSIGSKGKSPSPTGSSVLASSASTAVAGASFAKGRSIRTDDSAGSDSSKATDRNGLDGMATQPASSAATSSVLRTVAQPESSAKTSFTFERTALPWSSTTTSSTFGTAAQPASSTTTGSISGRQMNSVKSRPSQHATNFSWFKRPSSPSKDISSATATTSTSNDAHEPTVSTTPTSSTLPKASGETSHLTASSSTSAAETTKSSTSTTQGSLPAADPAPTDDPFQASSLPVEDNVSTNRSPPSSPPPA